jgi:hypothetical protein
VQQLLQQHKDIMLIFEVDYDAQHEHITEVAGLVRLQGQIFHSRVPRDIIVQALDENVAVVTIGQDLLGEWHSDVVEIYPRKSSNTRFIRTVGNNTKADNLGELPSINLWCWLDSSNVTH